MTPAGDDRLAFREVTATWRISCAVIALVVVACADARPVRLVAGRADTVIVNSRKWVALNLRLVDAAGESRAAKGAEFQLLGGDVELSKDGQVAPGRYQIDLFDANGAPNYLRLASHDMNCAPFPGTEQQYMCIARDRASVIVHHTEPAGRGRDSRATLLVHRMSDPDEEAAWRSGFSVLGCPYNIR